MKLSKIIVKNWHGKNFDFVPQKLNYAFHENGYGKTSLLDAIRYGISGGTPRSDARGCFVEMTEETTGLDIYRERGDSTVCKIGGPDGNKISEKQLNEKLSEISGVSPSNMKIISSSDVFSYMKPDGFLQLLLEYLPEQFDYDTLKTYAPDLSDDMLDTLGFFLPERFGIKELDKCAKDLSDTRKGYKTTIQQNQQLIAAMKCTPPTRGLEEIRSEMVNLEVRERMNAEGTAKSNEYEALLAKKTKQDTDLQNGLAWLNKHAAIEKPNEADLKCMMEERKECDNRKAAAIKDHATATATAKSFAEVLEALNQPICPISEKLQCTTDKTKVRNDITASLEAQKKLLETYQKTKEDMEARIRELDAMIVKFHQLEKAYANYQMVASRVKTMEENRIVLPPKPIAFNPDELKKQREALKAEEQNIDNNIRKKSLEKMTEQYQAMVDTYTVLINAISDKGPVKEGIIKHYVEYFESECNAHTKNSNGYKVSFVLDNGVKVYATTPSSKEPVYYMGLSSGEKIIVTFLVIDMLNSLTGMRMAFIDNLEQLDRKALEYVHKTITSEKFLENYDHIFVCGVNNKDILAVFKDEDALKI